MDRAEIVSDRRFDVNRLAGRARRASAILIAVVMTLAGSAPATAAHLADRIVAVVNMEVITLSELQAEIGTEESKLRAKYRGAELERRRRQLEFEALTRMIELKLQLQRANARGVQVSDEEVLAAIKEMKRQGEKLDESDPKAREHVKEQLTMLKVVDREVRGSLMVSELEMQRYYIQHQSRFLMPEEYRISQILIAARPDEDRAQARSRAASIYAQLQKGDDFSDLALKLSDGPEGPNGGSLGFVRQGELLPQIERALAGFETGKFTEPIETPQGLHIIRLEEKTQPQFRPFAEVKNEIQGLVYQQKVEDGFQSWLAELKDKAYIEVKLF
jgi:parvulin-like peptidyl-prolyl isomerase